MKGTQYFNLNFLIVVSWGMTHYILIDTCCLRQIHCLHFQFQTILTTYLTTHDTV